MKSQVAGPCPMGLPKGRQRAHEFSHWDREWEQTGRLMGQGPRRTGICRKRSVWLGEEMDNLINYFKTTGCLFKSEPPASPLLQNLGPEGEALNHKIPEKIEGIFMLPVWEGPIQT